MNGYEWDGTRWIPQATTARSAQSGWAPPAMGAPSERSQFPPLAGSTFTDARYGYGLTRQASDDIQFIARYLKIVIIVGLILLAVQLMIGLITVAGIIGIAGRLPHF